MANEINSVAGQLWGVPMGQVYTAGTGIKIDNVHKIITNDETVLYDTGSTEPTAITSETSIQLSESAMNFSIIRVYYRNSFGTVGNYLGIAEGWMSSSGTEFSPTPMITAVSDCTIMADSNSFYISSSSAQTLTVKAGGSRLNIKASGINTTASRGIKVYKVTGINRVS